MSNDKIKEKFTATMVHAEDKQFAIDLRKETNLTEKQTMSLIFANARNNRDAIVAAGKKIAQDELQETEERRKKSQEALKNAMKQAREQARIAQGKAPRKSKTETVEVPAAEPAN